MRQWIVLAAVALSLSLNVAHAANAQQGKMAACNKEAAGKKGDERKAFMSDCLSAEHAKPQTPQERMKSCSTDASGKKGDERKAFRSECLKK